MKNQTKDKQDEYSISRGNLMVLQLVPEMLQNKEYRKMLRQLCLDYYCKNSHKSLGLLGGIRK